ncbi:hypothetical protein [Parasphingorhabdus cellanae]|uniref:Lipoprotein n=1 Tax=Parasphingorhabdus cellanae TaxID=2806553 RepID=A0ABX7T5W8_9SPHN|nr:hypothetical protein [Parasphingorhabdus cellanae]QTD56167.1 hypothetical protein J4G78_00730 [Parasphingorhabdus cellanae]
MRKFLVISATILFAACTPVKEQAMTECMTQADAFPSSIDPEKICTCMTKDIPEDANTADAKKAMMGSLQACTSEMVDDMLKAGLPEVEDTSKAE